MCINYDHFPLLSIPWQVSILRSECEEPYVFSCLANAFQCFFSEMKMNIVDAQNACLAGGVAVGAIADLSLQPYGAVVIGSAVGILSTVGYQVIQVRIF